MNCQMSAVRMPAVSHPARLLRQVSRATSAAGHRRAGRAMTEFVLIALIPSFCLLMWTFLDADLKKFLLAGQKSDNATNVVYGLIAADKGTVASLHVQGQVRFWDLATSEQLGDIQSELAEVRFGAYSPHERLLVVGSAMGRLEVWDVNHPDRPIATSTDLMQGVTCCQFAPDGSVLICGGAHGSLSFWEPRTLHRLQLVTPPGPSDTTRSLAISSDGKTALTGLRNGAVHVWDLEKRTHRAFQVTQGTDRPDSTVESVGFLAGNAEFIAATRVDGVFICNTATGQSVRRCATPLSNIRSGALSPDGSRFVAGNDLGQLSVWDVTTGRQVKVVQQSLSVVRAVACNDRAGRVVTGDWTGTVQVHAD